MVSKETIAKRLKLLRGTMTMKEVSELLHISVSALAMYESGQRIPRDEIKVALAQLYGKSVESIFFAQ